MTRLQCSSDCMQTTNSEAVVRDSLYHARYLLWYYYLVLTDALPCLYWVPTSQILGTGRHMHNVKRDVSIYVH